MEVAALEGSPPQNVSEGNAPNSTVPLLFLCELCAFCGGNPLGQSSEIELGGGFDHEAPLDAPLLAGGELELPGELF